MTAPQHDDLEALRARVASCHELLSTYRARLGRFIRGYWIAFGVSVVFGSAILFLILDSSVDRINGAVRGTCSRQQDLRDESNRAFAIIVVDSRIAEGAIRALPLQTAATRRSASRLRMVSRLPRYLPSVDCDAAVDDPAHYRAPKSVRFNTHLIEAALRNERAAANP